MATRVVMSNGQDFESDEAPADFLSRLGSGKTPWLDIPLAGLKPVAINRDQIAYFHDAEMTLPDKEG